MSANPAYWDDGTPRSQGNAFDWRKPSSRLISLPRKRKRKNKISRAERERRSILSL